MRYLYILSLAIILSACRSGTIVEAEKNDTTKTEQTYWADEDYKTSSQSEAATPKVVKINPNIVIEPDYEEQPNITITTEKSNISVTQDQYAPAPSLTLSDETSRQLYTVLGSRAINKMLTETANLYKDEKPNLFLSYPNVDNRNMIFSSPEYAEVVAEDIIVGSESYNVVHASDAADYVLDTYISGATVAGRGTPVVAYRIILKDRQNKQIGTWSESVSQIANDDKSWW